LDKPLKVHGVELLKKTLELKAPAASASPAGFAMASPTGFAIISATGFAVISATGFAVI
jgi:hypothetical protein